MNKLKEAIKKSSGAKLGNSDYTFTDMETVHVLREAAKKYLEWQETLELLEENKHDGKFIYYNWMTREHELTSFGELVKHIIERELNNNA